MEAQYPADSLPKNPSIAANYHPESRALAEQLSGAISVWQAGPGAAITPTERNWCIAEAMHVLTWLRPLSHAPLMVLLDEERYDATR